MKKQIIALMLCTVLLLMLAPCMGAAADGALSLIAVDDLLPSELINAPANYGGMVYVPAWLFSGYGLGISYSYTAASSVACFAAGEKKLYFDLSSGTTYDSDDYRYSVQAIVRGGTVYVPLSFLCGYFGGFSYSSIGGNEYGSILRIRTGREMLTDEEFLRLARPAMQRYYNAYVQSAAPQPTAVPSAPPAGETAENAEPDHRGDIVRLGLEGLPSAEELALLLRLGVKAIFFLTAEEIAGEPDTVRRLSCEGFGLGVSCPDGSEQAYETASALLWETARVTAAGVLLPEEAEIPAGAAGFYRTQEAPADGDRMAEAYSVTAALSVEQGSTVLIFPCDAHSAAALSVLVYFLRDQEFTVTALRETDAMK